MNRFKTLLEHDLGPVPQKLKESKELSVTVKLPFSDYSKKGDMASVYAKRDKSSAEKLAKKQFQKKFTSFEIVTVEFMKLTKTDAIFTVTAKGE